MKQALYSLEDKEYSFLVQKLGESLSKVGLRHAIVGGAAVQMHVVGDVCNAEGKHLEDLIVTEEVSERQNLRTTNDIDLIIDAEPKAVLEYVKSLEGETTTEDGVYKLEITRLGLKRPKLKVESLNGIAEIALNISNDPKDLYRLFAGNYYVILEEAEEVEYTYEDLHPKVRVAKPEHIIATKLSRYNPKDQFDILNLADLSIKYGKPFDVAEIERCLDGEYPDRFEVFKDELELRKKAIEGK